MVISKQGMGMGLIVKSALAMYVVTIVRILIPFISFPYLSRVLGAEHFGKVMFALAYGNWIMMMVEYGFNYSGTRLLSKQKVDKDTISIVKSIQTAKYLLSLVIISLSIFFILIIPSLSHMSTLLIWATLMGVASGIVPLYYFQGKEKLLIPAIADTFTGCIGLASIFYFIRSPQNSYLYFVIFFCMRLAVTLACNYKIKKEIGEKIFSSCNEGLLMLKKCIGLAIFSVFVSLYTTLNTLILGFFVPSSQVAFFAGPEKIYKGLTTMISPLSQAIFPRLNSLTHNSPEKAEVFRKFILFLFPITGIFLGFFMYFSSSYFIYLFFGEGFERASEVLQILSVILPLVFLSNVLGVQYMLPMKMDRAFNSIIISAGCGNLIMAPCLIKLFGFIGVAWSMLLVELYICVMMFIFLVIRGKTLKIYKSYITNV